MYIPNKMKTKIASIFYDKEVEVLKYETSIDREGGVHNSEPKTIAVFKGNVSFSNCKRIQEEYGLDYEIDISITCDYTSIDKTTLLKYGDTIYNVSDILPFDSHLLIVGTKWQK